MFEFLGSRIWNNRQIFALLPVLVAGLPASAETEQHSFGLYYGGVKAAQVEVRAEVTSAKYSVSATMQASRLLSIFADIEHESTASGRIRNGDFAPGRFQSRTKTPKRQSEVEMEYRSGRPVVLSYRPERDPRPYDVNPSEQRGTRDITTTALMMFRSVAKEDLCDTTYELFDGRRRTRITLAEPKFKDTEAVCRGTFSRVAGYSESALAKRSEFEVLFTYEPVGDDRFRIRKFTAETTIGKAHAVRN